MKKIKTLDCRGLCRGMAALLLLVVSVAANAYDFVLSGICYNVVSEDDLTCEVTYYSETVSSNKEVYSGDITIPETVRHDGKTYSVVGICDSTFYECTDLSKVTIGGNVTTIGDYAFYGCTGMPSVIIGNGVTNIGEYAFSGCTGLTSVTIGNGVTNIEEYAFSGCTGLTEITIPESVTHIGGYAFRNCTGMTILNFNAVACPAAGFWNYYVASAFYGCDNISTVNFGDKVTIIPAYICDEMKGLTEVTIPNSVTEIGEYAFNYCPKLTSLTIGNSVTKIGYSAFGFCLGLTSVTIPNSVTTISSGAFEFCSGLTSVTIPNSVTEIGSWAFACTGLTSVTIPERVTSIGEYAFDLCRDLTKVNFNATACTYAGDGYSAFPDCTNISTFNFGDNVTIIPGFLCYGLSGLAEVTIPNNVITIGTRAFRECTGLTSVNIPNSVTEIGMRAFMNCSSLTEVTIPNSVTLIDDETFSGCTSLKEVTIPNSVTSIGGSAFYNCTGLRTLNSYNSTPPTCDTDVFENVRTDLCTLFVPIGAKSAYSIADQWKEFLYVEEVEVSPVADILAGGNAEPAGYYTTDGKQVSHPQRGINIIRYSDGTTKKVLVK